MTTLEEILDVMEWIPLQRYCALTGQNPSTLHMRRINHVWKEGVHISTPERSCTYVNIKAIAAWCAATGKPVEDIPSLLAARIEQERAPR